MNSEVIAKLQAPTPPDAIAYKPQGKVIASKHGPGYVCKALPYVDARFVMQRLDEAVGPENWATDVKNVGGLVAVGIGVYDADRNQWVWKWDTGMEANPFREAEAPAPGGGNRPRGDKRDDIAFKGLISNGLKRAANQWGIGRDVYNLRIGWKPCEVDSQNPEKWRAWLADGKPPQATEAAKRNGQGSFEHAGHVQEATIKILKVLSDAGVPQNDAREWMRAAVAKTDGSLDAYREVYRQAQVHAAKVKEG
jgi:hypothetical protein